MRVLSILLWYALVFMSLLGPFFGMAQQAIWKENFTAANGTTSDNGTTAWTSQCIGCTFANGNDYFQVASNRFEGRDHDGVGVWTSESIDISAYPEGVKAFVELVDVSNQLDDGDSLRAYYKLDNNPYMPFSQGSKNNDFTSPERVASPALRGSSLQIKVRQRSDNDNDRSAFDDVTVVALSERPGSGYALDFDNNNDYVLLPGHFPNVGGDDFTITAWFMTTNRTETGQRIFCDDESNGNGCYALSLGDNGAGQLRFFIRGVTNVSLDVTSATYNVANNTWYHVAVVHDASAKSRKIYLNGELAASDTYTGTMQDCSGPSSIGGETASGETSLKFQGQLDELTFWTTDLDQTAIRNLMCKKLGGEEANLIGYWRNDYAQGDTTLDYAGDYDGDLYNMNSADWVTSGASLGNTSSYLYTTGWSGQTVSLQSSEGDTFRVSSVNGTPRLVQVYHVESSPNTTSGSSGVGSNDHYFGVYHAFGTSTSYTGSYYYRENDAFQAGADESSLKVYTRTNNAATWAVASAIQNTSAKTLNMAALNTEFILGSSGVVLPVELLWFEAIPGENDVALNWSTATETSNDYFFIDKSANGIDWQHWRIVEASGNSIARVVYEEMDQAPFVPETYYRLHQVDIDGTTEVLGVQRVSFREKNPRVIVYPNPSSEHTTIETGLEGVVNLEVIATDGRRMATRKFVHHTVLDLITLPAGYYTIHLNNEQRSLSCPLVVQR